MNSNELFRLLEKVSAVNSQNVKAEVLRSHINDPLLLKVFAAGLNSFVTYGVTIDMTETGDGALVFDHTDETGVWSLLDRLAKRELTGNSARDAIEKIRDELEPASFAIFQRIINKDLRCAVTSTIVNKLIPGFIPVFDVMLAHKYEEKRIRTFPVAVEPKRDGVRVVCIVQNMEAKFYSRTGKPFPAIDHIGPFVVEALDRLSAWVEGAAYADPDHQLRSEIGSFIGYYTQSIVLEGEVVSGTFNKTVGDVRRKDVKAEDAVYEIFDAVSLKDFLADDCKDRYSFRRKVVEAFHACVLPGEPIRMLEQQIAHSHAEIQAIYEEFRTAGHEGAMVKPLLGLYQKKRSHAWLKIKAEESEDLIIVDAFEGEGKYLAMLGGLVVDRKGVRVKVGGGFSDAQRFDLWQRFNTGVDPIQGRLIEVEYHEVTPDGSLRHPRFIGWRDSAEAPGVKI